MATYLLDTTVFSLLVKEHPGVRGHLATLELTHRIVICTVVRGEVLYGLELMARGKKRQDLETKIMDLFSSLPCEPIPEDAGNHFGHDRQRFSTGERIENGELALTGRQWIITIPSADRRV